MIRRGLITLFTFLFLFWLFWPRAWLPSGTDAITPLEILSPNSEMIADDGLSSPDDAVILLLAPDQEAFPGARVLRTAGVPYVTTRDLSAALTHRFVFLPSGEKTVRMSARDRARLGAFVAGGGTLVVQAAGPLQWPELTGLQSAAPSRRRRRLVFVEGSDSGFRNLTRPEQKEIRLASPSIGDGVWTSALIPRPGAADVLARFDDPHEPAILRRRVGLGRVYALGFDLKDLYVRPQAARHFDALNSPDDPYQPGADVWPDIFRAWYEDAVPHWARLRALPGEASGLVLLTHSLESGDSAPAARDLAAWEAARGAVSTWFVQTDDSDGGQPGPFYDSRLAADLRFIAAQGDELAGHTVTHPENFESLPYGTGLENRRNYRPVTDGGSLWDATLMGEIRVPKEILDQDVRKSSDTGYRTPYLQYPEILDEALAGSGYAWDSSLTSAQTLTHHPFLLTRRRTMTRESRIVEFPMTLQDEAPSRRPPLEAADVLRALRQVSDEEGILVWQTRPQPARRAVEAAFLDALPAGTALETMGPASRWWSARSRTRFRLEWNAPGKPWTLRMTLPPEADGARVSFEVFAPVRSCASLTPELSYSCDGRIVTVYATGGVRDAALTLQLEQLDPAESRGVPGP